MTVLSLRRVTAVGALTVALAVPALPASADTAQSRARVADGWLTSQLVDGSHFEVTFGGSSFPDQGLTIDGILAFASARVAERQQRAATAWLTQPDILAGYIGDGAGESYAGAHAKAALALQAPSGRLVDRSAFGDFSNGFSQALAVIALKRSGAPFSPAARYLARQACADGGVPIQLEQTTCTSTIDATALAVQAFHAAGQRGPARRAAAWLVAHQNADGGFGDGTTNANSTGLAAAALDLEHLDGAARRAQKALGTLQQGCSAPVADRGAIAADGTGFDPATATRATAQAVLGLAEADLATLTGKGSSAVVPTLRCSAGAR